MSITMTVSKLYLMEIKLALQIPIIVTKSGKKEEGAEKFKMQVN